MPRCNTDRLGITGYCRGGRTVWRYSTDNPGLKAGVAFYGSLADPPTEAMPVPVLATAKDIKTPVLGLYGAENAGIPVYQVKQMEAALKATGKTAEFHIYPGAPHGFHADYRPSYRKEAAEDAWRWATRRRVDHGIITLSIRQHLAATNEVSGQGDGIRAAERSRSCGTALPDTARN